MSEQEGIGKEKDRVLLRLELYLDGKNVEDGEMTLARLSDLEPATDKEVTDDQLCELACRIYESRRLRAKFLSQSLFGEPAWDMLLALYCFSSRGEKLSVSGLCYAADAPPTTALRWSQIMEQKRLIRRVPDIADARRHYLELTEEGLSVMRKYLSAIHNWMTG